VLGVAVTKRKSGSITGTHHVRPDHEAAFSVLDFLDKKFMQMEHEMADGASSTGDEDSQTKRVVPKEAGEKGE
jgi:hypothetical protein